MKMGEEERERCSHDEAEENKGRSRGQDGNERQGNKGKLGYGRGKRQERKVQKTQWIIS